jgi:hypothetical protein
MLANLIVSGLCLLLLLRILCKAWQEASGISCAGPSAAPEQPVVELPVGHYASGRGARDGRDYPSPRCRNLR